MRINYNVVLTQARQIQDLGEELKRVADELNTMMSEIPQAWNGEAAKAYLKACGELRQNVLSSSQKINTLSSDIRIIAKKIHDEDERMAKMAAMPKKYV